MAINKVVYDNNTLIDLTSDTIIAEKLFKGYTAHDGAGNKITGTYIEPTPPSGSLEITESGTYDVTNYEQVVVNVATNEPIEMEVVTTTGSGKTTTSTVNISETGVYLLDCDYVAVSSSTTTRKFTSIMYIADLSKVYYSAPTGGFYYTAAEQAIYASTVYNGQGYHIYKCYKIMDL